MPILNNLELIRRVPIFLELTREQIEPLLSASVIRRYKRGELIVQKGKISKELYVMLSGRADVTTTAGANREIILASLQAGDCIGEMSLIDKAPHSANVRACVASDVLVLTQEGFIRCLNENTSLAYSVIERLVARLRVADKKIESLALQGLNARVANTLIDAATSDRNGSMIIKNKMSKQNIAKLVGASRESVSRAIKVLENSGFISISEDSSIKIFPHLHPTRVEP